MKVKMRIGELADQAGVTPRTIRYYEDLGLLGPCEREGHGFRYYSDAELTRLKKIDVLKQLGLSLEEIAEVIPMYCEDPTGLRSKRRVLEILEKQLRETDEKITTLQRFRSEIDTNIAKIREFIVRTEAE
jgi:DNA-binding transcriptional MerR regulator